MEIAALNERLRDAFTPLLKHLAHLERLHPPPLPSVPSAAPVVRAPIANSSRDQPLPPPPPPPSSSPANATAPTAVAPTTARGGDAQQYRAHCLTVLKRLNMYQYGTRAAFVRDLQQLEQLAAADDAVRLLQSIMASVKDCERPEASDAPPSKKPKTMAPAVMIHGLRFSYSGVPSIQQASSVSANTSASAQGDAGRTRWRCNVNVQDVVLTMGERESPNAALALYEAQRRELGQSAHGLASLMRLSDQRRADQKREDEQILRDALSVCIPRLASSTSVRVPDLIAPNKPTASSSAGNNSSSGSNRDERPAMVSSPTSSVASSISTATSSVSRASNWRNPKRKKPAHRLAFLRLRRLIQKKLCHHLRGQPVCVFSRPDSVDRANASAWVPTGRLEGGRVVVLKTRKQVSFADYVSSELGHPASACAHMFLVRTQESIDDHLKVCDAFSEEDREQLGHDLYGSVRNYMQAKDERR